MPLARDCSNDKLTTRFGSSGCRRAVRLSLQQAITGRSKNAPCRACCATPYASLSGPGLCACTQMLSKDVLYHYRAETCSATCHRCFEFKHGQRRLRSARRALDRVQPPAHDQDSRKKLYKELSLPGCQQRAICGWLTPGVCCNPSFQRACLTAAVAVAKQPRAAWDGSL